MNIIEIENLYFNYDAQEKNNKHYTLNNVSLNIKKGEFVSILGHNGSGKSTLAMLLIGLLEAVSGTIKVDGVVLDEKSVYDIRKKIGIVFQNPDNQFVGVTVKDDIAFGLENKEIENKKMVDIVSKCAEVVGMSDFLEHNPEQLSGGEKQRVAIAGVLAINPEVIIFDESTSMLDPKGVREVHEVVRNLKGKKTIIAITHNLAEVLDSDKVVVMNDGNIVLVGTPKEVFTQKQVLKDSNLDILESMKLLELIEQDDSINQKEKLEEALWELTFKK